LAWQIPQTIPTFRDMLRSGTLRETALTSLTATEGVGTPTPAGPRENTPETVLVDRATGVAGSGGTTVSPASGGSSILPLILLALLAL